MKTTPTRINNPRQSEDDFLASLRNQVTMNAVGLELKEPDHAAVYVLRRAAGISIERAAWLVGRSRATACQWISRIEARRREDARFAGQLDALVFIAERAVTERRARKAGNTALIERILSRTARAYSLRPEELRLRTNEQRICRPRHVACWLLRIVAGLSLPQIAALLGCHHTTVLHSLRWVERRRREDPRLRDVTDTLVATIEPTGAEILAARASAERARGRGRPAEKQVSA